MGQMVSPPSGSGRQSQDLGSGWKWYTLGVMNSFSYVQVRLLETILRIAFNHFPGAGDVVLNGDLPAGDPGFPFFAQKILAKEMISFTTHFL